MKLSGDIIIPRDKLTKYLLVFQPENDKSRFLARAGFTQANPDALELAIRRLVAENDAVLDRHDQYGDFYRIEGILHGNNENTLHVVTIWIIRSNETGVYRFVTLKPRRKSDNAT